MVWTPFVLSTMLRPSATPYSYGPKYTVGVVGKLCGSGGLVVIHSSPVALYGLFPAFLPKNRLAVR